jgi:hypothetical protein
VLGVRSCMLTSFAQPERVINSFQTLDSQQPLLPFSWTGGQGSEP